MIQWQEFRDEETSARHLQDGDGLVAGDGGELLEEVVEIAAAFEVVEEVLDGDAGAGEAGSSAHDVGAGVDGVHGVIVASEAGRGGLRIWRFRSILWRYVR